MFNEINDCVKFLAFLSPRACRHEGLKNQAGMPFIIRMLVNVSISKVFLNKNRA